MAKYAEDTRVTAAQSRAEIEKTLRRYGADGFVYGWQNGRAFVGFTLNRRQVRFSLALPSPKDPAITHSHNGKRARSPEQQLVEYEKAERQRWRALALVIKAKLEAVESGISVFDEEFLANIVLPGGKTAGEYVIPEIDAAYSTGKVKGLLPHFTE